MQELPVSLFTGDDTTEDSDNEKGIAIEESTRDNKLFKMEVVSE